MSNGWASESQHWYAKDGTPAYTQIGKNGKERPTTVTDARKLGLLPSVTKIIRCAASFGLERWKAEQLLMAGLTLPRTEGESEADWIKRVWEDSQAQAQAAAERGTRIHAAIEQYYRGESFDRIDIPDHPWVEATAATIRFTFGQPQWNAEKSFATSSYGGKVDLHADGLVLDIKTKDGSLADVKLYDEHAMQLSAYSHGLGLQPPYRAGIVFVSRTEPKCVVKELDAAELERGWSMFTALLAFWQAQNRMEVA